MKLHRKWNSVSAVWIPDDVGKLTTVVITDQFFFKGFLPELRIHATHSAN